VLAVATLLLALALAGGGAGFAVLSLRERFAQQRALRDVNNRWEIAADAANTGVFVWQPEGDVLELDERARRLYGVDPDSRAPVTRGEVLERLHPEDRRPAAALDADELQGTRLRRRYRVLLDDGTVRHLEATGEMRRAAGTRPAQVFGVVRDVTDEVARASIQLEKEAAERAARARTEFLSRLSHELRTPLNAILGLAQVMEMDAAEPLQPRQAQRIKLILEGGWHLLHLVDDVLDISRIDSGAVALRVAPTALRDVLATSLGLIEPERHAFGIDVRDELPPHPPDVLADPHRLQQVLVNLLSNGCKYNRRGGRLTIGCRERDGRVCIDVRDEGEGMDEQQLAELFQPFKRMTRAAEVPGTGLGLTVVKLLVEQMGGSIEVRSAPGEGSRFTVCLRPAATAGAAA
jgi:PAS domain S-box-containing protein